MSDLIGNAVIRALKDMKSYGPEDLEEAVAYRLRRTEETVTKAELVELLLGTDVNDPVRFEFHTALPRWDAAAGVDWLPDSSAEYTQPNTPERRADVLRRLGFTGALGDRLSDAFPINPSELVVIDEPSADWTDWYTPQRAAERTFYWDAYRGVLEKKGFDPAALTGLDQATHEVVRRLADPSRTEAYQAKGLVVGHVQSGKTANFTGVIAKAVDSGYRLVIVLTGTIELLRQQTQRRLDMELIGKENILGGIDPTDSELLKDVDYANGDRDWDEGRFLELGQRPGNGGPPAIRRLTGQKWDFRALRHGIDTLDFRAAKELADPVKPVYDPENLFGTDVRIAVVKKNTKALGDLIKDLKRIRARAGEIPALIIDDEADLASVNSLKDKRISAEERKERTRINGLISELLGELKRAQYVGYTATPFANVFVDPDDAEDLFPKDFIISLPAPPGYMGGRGFHDLHLGAEEVRTLANSNEAAFVRDVTADPDDAGAWQEEFIRALDSFVLAGAVKLWRDSLAGTSRAHHHTMLVHESVRMAEHENLAHAVVAAWNAAAYNTPRGQRRLHTMWEEDILPVSRVRADGEPVPEDFLALREHIGEAVRLVTQGASPVVVVNGNKESDYTQDALDFQAGRVWKILVGGAKLSRGFTVEGLTVFYYTRRSLAADTLMQMGRWFGYRRGYADLVRLYLGRAVPGPRKGTTVDLYHAFEAMVRDEEEFREQLRMYQGRNDDGTPRVTPREVPPLVLQSVPWLRPTARNKMYNAQLVIQGAGGQVKDFFQHPPRDKEVNRHHFGAVGPLLDLATDVGTFGTDTGGSYAARYGIVDLETVRTALRKFRWQPNFEFGPTLEFYDRAVASGDLIDWVVLVPLLEGPAIAERRIGTRTEPYQVQKRERRDNRGGAFSGSSPRQRPAMQFITGGLTLGDPLDEKTRRAVTANPLAADLHRSGRGALLLTFAADTGQGSVPGSLPDPVSPEQVATLFSLAFPLSAARSPRVGFKVISQAAKDQAIIDRVAGGD